MKQTLTPSDGVAGTAVAHPEVAGPPPREAAPRAVVPTRFDFVDVARGTAMLFVLLSHFTDTTLGGDPAGYWLFRISLVASPMFMIISGLTAGMICEVSPERFRKFRRLLLDRGLFLLTIGHVLMLFGIVAHIGSFGNALRTSLITDTIGLSIILGPLFVARLGARPRLLLAAAIYLGSSWLALTWHPAGDLMTGVRELLVGGREPRIMFYTFPLLQWLAVYMAGTALGTLLGTYARTGRLGSAHVPVLGVGFALIATAVAAAVAARLLDPLPTSFLRIASSPLQKWPPGPVYLFFYGGAAVVLLGAVMWIERRGVLGWARGHLRVLGQTSLFVFILQYYVYWTGFALLRLPVAWWWPLALLASVGGIVATAQVWHRRGYNRFLKVRTTRPRAAASTP